MNQQQAGKRCVLSEREVKDIFLLKHKHGHKNLHAASVVMAKKYNVSSKTIRDIWNGRCWMKTTAEFWSEDELSSLSKAARSRRKKRVVPDEEIFAVDNSLRESNQISPGKFIPSAKQTSPEFLQPKPSASLGNVEDNANITFQLPCILPKQSEALVSTHLGELACKIAHSQRQEMHFNTVNNLNFVHSSALPNFENPAPRPAMPSPLLGQCHRTTSSPNASLLALVIAAALQHRQASHTPLSPFQW
mmetsp:Transcript_68441/g.182575  ORF Transcript_68441/g.182575 Transcript_68441/m.182575 type:complete len:247 (-) Transcript_68441:300-1040(-)|eukprot:CAMPEP_0113684820 /NCGR_PEP_ID=MMETSP0038_2-20120614/14263_1 /TAXON_ID=2898 /ORGANISM="Cryptomonas paramecium" /LENGTH=246 /DNA_ID=CAMNT_0000604707 /DNA_START=213 /DNA_END=950 /DNA_ORIENTATION=- /assembly_acc=CAM_ASM_000170